MRYFLHLAYKGSNYHGWQRQPNASSVQATIETGLSKMLKVPTKIHGCGRTDAGVHASQYFAHFDYEGEWNYDPVERLNLILPGDIAIFEIIPVHEKANTQQGAFRRTYDYFMHFRKHPFLTGRSALFAGLDLNLEEMRRAGEVLTQHKDFRALCKTPDKVPHTRCNLMSVKIFEHPKGEGLRINVESNRFLKGMIRLMVTKLVEVGTGKISVAELDEFIGKQVNPSYKVLAPPQGLYLSKIEYRYLSREPALDYLQPW